MKTRRVLLILLIVLILATSGSVVAYMYTRTGVRENTFLPAQVSCTVNETVQDNAKTSIVVSNTSNIEAYVRLRLVSYWVNSSDEVIAKRATLPALTPDNGLASGWLAGPNDTYYYSYPVGAAPDGTTPNLLATGASIPMAVDEDGNRQVIEVFAEAIQSKPRGTGVSDPNVVRDRWGVTVDATGTITAAPTEATTDEP
jgi:hypothetical protein